MGRIALKIEPGNHQYHYLQVVNGEATKLTRDELENLYEAKRIYLTAVYEGQNCG